jgi:hypothetical protein
MVERFQSLMMVQYWRPERLPTLVAPNREEFLDFNVGEGLLLTSIFMSIPLLTVSIREDSRHSELFF